MLDPSLARRVEMLTQFLALNRVLLPARTRPSNLVAMPIVGHGIDIVETGRIKKLCEEHTSRFLDRVFTPLEQAYCARNPKRYFEHLSGRFAAKEAVMKVIRRGWQGGVAWTDIEIRPESSGQ